MKSLQELKKLVQQLIILCHSLNVDSSVIKKELAEIVEGLSKFLITAVGPAGVGKSTFWNAILGKRILKAKRVGETTGVLWYLVHDDKLTINQFYYKIHLKSGKVISKVTKNDLKQYNNNKDVKYITLVAKIPFLTRLFLGKKIAFGDSPGHGTKRFKHHNKNAQKAMSIANKILFFVKYDRIGDISNINAIKEVLKQQKYSTNFLSKLVILINKVDTAPEAFEKEKKELARMLNQEFPNISKKQWLERIFGISALAALCVRNYPDIRNSQDVEALLPLVKDEEEKAMLEDFLYPRLRKLEREGVSKPMETLLKRSNIGVIEDTLKNEIKTADATSFRDGKDKITATTQTIKRDVEGQKMTLKNTKSVLEARKQTIKTNARIKKNEIINVGSEISTVPQNVTSALYELNKQVFQYKDNLNKNHISGSNKADIARKGHEGVGDGHGNGKDHEQASERGVNHYKHTQHKGRQTFSKATAITNKSKIEMQAKLAHFSQRSFSKIQRLSVELTGQQVLPITQLNLAFPTLTLHNLDNRKIKTEDKLVQNGDWYNHGKYRFYVTKGTLTHVTDVLNINLKAADSFFEAFTFTVNRVVRHISSYVNAQVTILCRSIDARTQNRVASIDRQIASITQEIMEKEQQLAKLDEFIQKLDALEYEVTLMAA